MEIRLLSLMERFLWKVCLVVVLIGPPRSGSTSLRTSLPADLSTLSTEQSLDSTIVDFKAKKMTTEIIADCYIQG